MEIHAPGAALLDSMMSQLKTQQRKEKLAAPFEDPIREFHKASRVEGLVSHWLTLSVDARKTAVAKLVFTPRYLGDKHRHVEPESEQAFETRKLENWRALMVVIQEETRAAMNPDKFEHSAEVAIMALKLALPDHPWNKGK